MHPAIEIALLHMFLAAAWSLPARRLMPDAHPVGALGFGYILGATLLLILNHGLELLALRSPIAVWIGWMTGWILLMRVPSLRSSPLKRRIFVRDGLGVCVLMLVGLGLRLHDPLHHPSLAAGDSYVILQHVHRFMVRGTMFHEYIAGLPVLIGSLRCAASPLEVLRFAPAVIASLCIPAFFALGYALGGRNVAWMSALIMAAGVGFLHVASLYLVFVQFTTLALGLPYLLILTPQALQNGGFRNWSMAGCVWIFLTLTATYFALLLAAAASTWMILCRVTGSISTPKMLRGLLLAMVVPAWIGFHYAVAAPVRNPKSETTFTSQVGEFERLDRELSNGLVPAPLKETSPGRLSPVISGLRLFVLPKRFEWIRPSLLETTLLWTLALLSMQLLRSPASTAGCTGMLMLFAFGCTVTGMFEMPAYQGRYLFIFILLGLPIGARFLVHQLTPCALRWTRKQLPPARLAFRRKSLHALTVLLCAPSFVFPPEAGVTLPTAEEIQVREAPEDDVITRLFLGGIPGSKLRVLFIYRNRDDRLRGANVAALNFREKVVRMECHHLVLASGRGLLRVLLQGVPSVYVMSRGTWVACGFEKELGHPPGDGVQVIYDSGRTVVVAPRSVFVSP